MDDVRAVVDRYLALADATLPGQIENLYLTGSLALDDYRPGQSDLDFVAVTPTPLAPEELDRLEAVHRTLNEEIPRPPLSGVYVTGADLGRNPEEIERVPFYLEGQWGRTGGFDANPATWLTLRNHPLAVRGPIPQMWHDAAAIRRWTVDNLNSYWRDTLSRLERRASSAPVEMVPQIVSWCVPGPIRLHYTIVTGDVTSKSGACRWALERYEERWHAILAEALALRQGAPPGSRDPRSQLVDTAALMRYVIEEANR